MDKSEFKDLLMLYGADLGAWPAELKREADILLSSGGETASELEALMEEEDSFETLLAERSFEEPDVYLATRIIASAEESANEESALEGAGGLFGALFAEFFGPKVFVALALTLVIGFMVGYMTPQNSIDQLALEDEMMIEESFSSLFMEGDFFE